MLTLHFFATLKLRKLILGHSDQPFTPIRNTTNAKIRSYDPIINKDILSCVTLLFLPIDCNLLN